MPGRLGCPIPGPVGEVVCQICKACLAWDVGLTGLQTLYVTRPSWPGDILERLSRLGLQESAGL